MDRTLPPRLHANLESAVQRVRMAARSAAEQTVDSLGLAALGNHNLLQRDALLGAQYELNRKLAIFALTFNEALDTDVARQSGLSTPSADPALTADSPVASWESLTLVDDHELEIHISADRFALEISHACEREIRELDAYMGRLMGLDAAEHDRNPLRAEVVGRAMIRAIDAVSDRPEVRKVLSTEIGRSLAQAMRQTYGDVVADMRHAGVRPVGLALRNTPSRGNSAHGGLSLDPTPGDSGAGHATSAYGTPQGMACSSAPGRGGFGPSSRSQAGTGLGRVDGEMMALIRRLAQSQAPGGGHDELHDFAAASTHSGFQAFPEQDGAAYGGATDGRGGGGGGGGARPIAPNLIVAYRDELRQASTGTLDHMVIDVIASLFDQILSDGKVPPQVARHIARLQLPVLRAALGDNSFFSSRKHPVRRFINRIASLGTAVDDFECDEGQALLARVAGLVQEVVDGDFEQIEVYEQKLQALEAFIATQAGDRLRALGSADVLLGRKEDLLRVQQRFALELDGALQGLPVPGYLRDFLSAHWSRAIASAAQDGSDDDAAVQRLREAGRELVMSVQPKGTPADRQLFLRKLPQLMKDLNGGLDRIGCPEPERRAFFAQLLPAHAESLKGQSLSTLEHNLLLRRVDGALATPVPRAADVPAPASSQSVATLQAMSPQAMFTPAEAAAVGLVDEASVDWGTQVDIDIDLGAEPELMAVDLAIAGLPTPDAVEPCAGKSLADHVQIGFAYRMLLKGDWQQVRLSHVSPGRGFFVFTHGAKQRAAVSMTHRMLVKLCTDGRLRALENAYLLERATARARRQLAQLAQPRSAPGAPPPIGAASGQAQPAARRPLAGGLVTRRD